MRRFLLSILILLPACTNKPTAVEDPAAIAPLNRVTFLRGADIWTMNPDGSGAVMRIKGDFRGGPSYCEAPRFSPLREEILVTSVVSYGRIPMRGDARLFRHLPGTSTITQFTSDTVDFYRASFSPDGKQIVVVRNGELAVMDANGANLRLMGHNAGSTSFGPGGTIAFTTRINGIDEVAKIKSDGTGYMQLTSGSNDNVDAAISPDGRLIAYRSWRNGDADIYLMNSDGSNVRQLTTSIGFDGEPVFSPDSRRIMFTSRRSSDGFDHIYVMNVDGSDVRRVDTGSDGSHSPDWR